MSNGHPRPDAAVPLLDRRGATWAQTFGNIVVSILGTGSLGLPYAFRVAGWLAGSLGLAVAAVAVYYCMLLLVQCRKKIEEEVEEGDDGIQTLGDLGAKAFGAAGRFLTELLILVSYSGGAVAYLLFVRDNLSSVFSRVPPSSLVFFVLLPLEIALSFIRSLSILAPFSAFAVACNALTLAIVLSVDVQRLGSLPKGAVVTRSAFNGPWSLPFAGGVAVFCFEGFGMTLSLESSMAERRKFPWVLLQAFLGIATVYICFGVLGFLAYGDETKEIATLNLPDDWLAAIVKIGLGIAISFTFPMAILPVHEIIESKLEANATFQKLCHNLPSRKRLGQQAVRVLVLVAVAFLATFVPGFAVLISFMGSTVCALIAFVLPATVHLRLMGFSLNLWQRVLDYSILSIGLVFAVYSACAALSGHSLDS